MTKATIKAPAHFSDKAKAFWKHVTTSFKLDEHHTKILETACESLDRAEAARKSVAVDGMCVHNRHGELIAHPAVKIEREARALFMRAVREMGLDLADTDSPRPPTRTGRRML